MARNYGPGNPLVEIRATLRLHDLPLTASKLT
jgi:hypothetical protein